MNDTQEHNQVGELHDAYVKAHGAWLEASNGGRDASDKERAAWEACEEADRRYRKATAP